MTSPTELGSVSPVVPVSPADARDEASHAAATSGLEIHEVATPDELDELREVMRSIWGPEIVPPRNLLRGLALGGNCLLIARRDRTAVGFAVGWLGWADGVHFHSHQVGVQSGRRGGGVGYALKLAQRALCLDHGITEMRWTYDPMLMSNARFNLLRLGARVIDFIPHCYGDRRDAFNTGERTDRLEVSWRLDVPVGGVAAEPSAGELLPVPIDYAHLRATDPDTAATERMRVGTRLTGLIDTGEQVLGVCSDGYVIGGSAREGDVT